MSPRGLRSKVVFCVALTVSVPAWVLAEEAGRAAYMQGHYLQTEEKDPAGAAAAFEKVVADRGAPEEIQRKAKERLAQCREDLKAKDLAGLMPPDALAYVEITQPGAQVERLAELMGLLREPGGTSTASEAVATPLGEGLFFPEDFTISPALIEALKAFNAAAVAVTDIDERNGPAGVLVVHPGDSGLIRGLIETTVQVNEPVDPIEGFKTYRVQGEVWITVTNRLFIASRSQQQLAATVDRLLNSDADSLASQDDFKTLANERDDALLFAYVSGPRMMTKLSSHLRGHEALAARALFDLDHVAGLSARVGTNERGVQAYVKLDLMEGHHNLAYGLIRTAPCTQRLLDHVPSGAAAVVLLGLNASDESSRDDGKSDGGPQYLTGMDLGREVFANIEEIALFVSEPDEKPKTGPAVPDVGIVIASRDSAKSEALWRQLLALPGTISPHEFTPPREMTIEGLRATEFRLPEVPPIVLVRVDDRAIIAGTRAAAAAAIRTGRGGESIRRDAAFQPLMHSLTSSTSKALLLHVGRALPIAAGLADGHEAEELTQAGSLLSTLTASLVTHETPTRFVAHGGVSGLPDVPEIIKTLAQARRHTGQTNRDAAPVAVTRTSSGGTSPAEDPVRAGGTRPVARSDRR